MHSEVTISMLGRRKVLHLISHKVFQIRNTFIDKMKCLLFNFNVRCGIIPFFTVMHVLSLLEIHFVQYMIVACDILLQSCVTTYVHRTLTHQSISNTF